MLAKTFSYFLTAGLGEFFEEESFSASNVQLGVLSGFVVLENLRCKKSIFDKSGLPLQLAHGSFGRLELRIPWSNIWNEQVTVAIDRVLFVLESRYEYDDKEDKRRQMDAVKAAQLAAFELMASASSRAAPVATSSSSWGLFKGSYITQYAQKLLKAVIDNIHISLREVHIRYEDRTSCTQDYCCGVTLESLTLASLNQCDQATSFKHSTFLGTSGSVFKDFQMYQLSVYCNPLAAKQISQSDVVAACVCDMSHHAATVTLSRTIPKRGYTFQEAPKHNFLLKPLNASTHLRLLVDPVGHTVTIEMQMNIAAIHTSISSKQLQCMLTTADTMSSFMLVNTYYYLRPDCSVSEDRRAWWRYAAAAVIAQIGNSVQKDMTKQRLIARRRDRMVYCELWKSKMVHVGKRRGRSRTMSEGSVSEMYDQMSALYDTLLAKYNNRKSLRDQRIRDRSLFSRGQLVQLMPYADWTPLSRALLSAIERRRTVEDIAFFRSQADLQLSQEGFQPSSSRSIVSRLSLGLFTSDDYDETVDEQKLLDAITHATAEHTTMQQTQSKDAYKLKIEIRHIIEEVTLSLSLSGDRIVEQAPFFIANLYGLSTSVACQSGEGSSFPVQITSRIDGFEVLEGVSPVDQDSDDVFSGLRRYIPICWVHTEPLPDQENDALSISSSYDVPSGDPLHLSRYSSPPPRGRQNNSEAYPHEHTSSFFNVNLFFDAGNNATPHVDVSVVVQGTDLWIHENSVWIEKMVLFAAPTDTQKKVSAYHARNAVPGRSNSIKDNVNVIVQALTTNALVGINLDLTVVSPRLLLSTNVTDEMEETKSDALSIFTDMSHRIKGMCSAHVIVVSLGTITVKTEKNVRLIRDRAIMNEFRDGLALSTENASPSRGDLVRESRVATIASENSLLRLSNSVMRPPLPAAKSERELFIQSPGSLYSPTAGKSRYFTPPSPRTVESSTIGDVIRISVSGISIHVTNNVPTEKWKQLSIEALTDSGSILRSFSATVEYQNVTNSSGRDMKGLFPCRLFVDTSRIELSLSLKKIETILHITGALMAARLPALFTSNVSVAHAGEDMDITEDEISFYDTIAETKSNATQRSRYRKAAAAADTTFNDDDFLSAQGDSDDDACSVESLAMAHEAATLRLALEDLEKLKSNILDDMLTSYGDIGDEDDEEDHEREEFIRRKEAELKDCEAELQRIKVSYVEVMMKLDIERYTSLEASGGDHNDEESLSSRGSSRRYYQQQRRSRDSELVESTARPLRKVENNNFSLGNCDTADPLLAVSLNLGDVQLDLCHYEDGSDDAAGLQVLIAGSSVRVIHTAVTTSGKAMIREFGLSFHDISSQGTIVIPIISAELSQDASSITNLLAVSYNVRYAQNGSNLSDMHKISIECARNPSTNIVPSMVLKLTKFVNAVTDSCSRFIPAIDDSKHSAHVSYDKSLGVIVMPELELTFTLPESSATLLTMDNKQCLRCVSSNISLVAACDENGVNVNFLIGNVRIIAVGADDSSSCLLRKVGNTGQPMVSIAGKAYPPRGSDSMWRVASEVNLAKVEISTDFSVVGGVMSRLSEVMQTLPVPTSVRSTNESEMPVSSDSNAVAETLAILQSVVVSFKLESGGVAVAICALNQLCIMDLGVASIMFDTSLDGSMEAVVTVCGTNIQLDGICCHHVLAPFDTSLHLFAALNPPIATEPQMSLNSLSPPMLVLPSASNLRPFLSLACSLSPIHFTVSDALNVYVFRCLSAIDTHILPHISIQSSTVAPPQDHRTQPEEELSSYLILPFDIFLNFVLHELCVFLSVSDPAHLPSEFVVHYPVEEISDESPKPLTPVFAFTMQDCSVCAEVTAVQLSAPCSIHVEHDIRSICLLYFGSSACSMKRVITSQVMTESNAFNLSVNSVDKHVNTKCLLNGLQCAICPEILLSSASVIAVVANVWLPEREKDSEDGNESESHIPSMWERSEVFALRRRLDASPPVETSLQTLSGVQSSPKNIFLSEMSFMLPIGLTCLHIEVELVNAGVWVAAAQPHAVLHSGFSCKGVANFVSPASGSLLRYVDTENVVCDVRAHIESLHVRQDFSLPSIFHRDVICSMPSSHVSPVDDSAVLSLVGASSTSASRKIKYLLEPVNMNLQYTMQVRSSDRGILEVTQKPNVIIDHMALHVFVDYRCLHHLVEDYTTVQARAVEITQCLHTPLASSDTVGEVFQPLVAMCDKPVNNIFELLQEVENVADISWEICLGGAEVVLIDDSFSVAAAAGRLVLLPANISVASNRKVSTICTQGVWCRYLSRLPLRISASCGMELYYRNCRLLAWEPALERMLFTIDVSQPQPEASTAMFWHSDLSCFPCSMQPYPDIVGDVDTSMSPHASVSVHFSKDININVTSHLLYCIGMVMRNIECLSKDHSDESKHTAQAVFRNDTGYMIVYRPKNSDELRRVASYEECALFDENTKLGLSAPSHLSMWAITADENAPYVVDENLYVRAHHKSHNLDFGAGQPCPMIVSTSRFTDGEHRLHIRSTLLLRNSSRLPMHIMIVSGTAPNQHGRKVLWEAVINSCRALYVPAQFCCQASNRILLQPLFGEHGSESTGYVQYVEYAEIDVPILPNTMSKQSDALCQISSFTKAVGSATSSNTHWMRQRSKSDWNKCKINIRPCRGENLPENSTVQYSQWLHCPYLPASHTYMLHGSQEYTVETSKMLAGGHKGNDGINIVSHIRCYGKTNRSSSDGLQLHRSHDVPYQLREIEFTSSLFVVNTLSCDIDVVCSRSRIITSKRRGIRRVDVDSTIAAGGHIVSIATGDTADLLNYHPSEEISMCILLKFTSQNLEVWSDVVTVRACEKSEEMSIKLAAAVLYPNGAKMNINCDVDEVCGQRRLNISAPYWVVNASSSNIQFQHAIDEDLTLLLSSHPLNGSDSLAPGQTVVAKHIAEPTLLRSITEVRRLAKIETHDDTVEYVPKASVTMCGYTDDLYSTCNLRFRLNGTSWSRAIAVSNCNSDVFSISVNAFGKTKKNVYCVHTKQLDSLFRNTCVVMITEYHKLTNLLTESIEIRLNGDETILNANHGETIPMNWYVGSSATLQFRLKGAGWLWSGKVSAEDIGVSILRVTNPFTQAIMIVEVQVIKENGVMQCILRTAQAHAPYRIENYSTATVKIFQVNASVHTTLPPYHGCDYAWDEPLLQPLLTLEGRYHDEEYEWQTVGLFSFDKCEVSELNFFMVVAVQIDDGIGVMRIMDKNASLNSRYVVETQNRLQMIPVPETRILVTVPHINVSLVDEKPSELLACQVAALTVDVVQSSERLCVTTACEFIQFDDQLSCGVDSGPVLQVLPQEVPGCQKLRSLSFHMTQDLRKRNAIVYSIMQMSSVSVIVSLQEMLLRRIVSMFSSLPHGDDMHSRQLSHANIAHASTVAADVISRMLEATYKYPKEVLCQPMYSIRHMILPAVALNITLCPCSAHIVSDYGTPSLLRNLVAAADTLVRKFATDVIKIEHVPLSLHSLEMESVSGSQEQIGMKILHEYQLQLMNRIVRRVLSPETILYSAADTAIYTMLSAVRNISAALQESIRTDVLPSAMRPSLQTASERRVITFLGSTVLNGVIGAAVEPARGFYHNGIIGFAAGCARASVGLGALPLYGAAGAVHRGATYLTSNIYPSVSLPRPMRIYTPRLFIDQDTPLTARGVDSDGDASLGENLAISLTQEGMWLHFDRIGLQLLKENSHATQKECLWSCKYSSVLLVEIRDSNTSDAVDATDVMIRRFCEDSSSSTVQRTHNAAISVVITYSVAGDERMHVIEVTPMRRKDCNVVIRVLRQRVMSSATYNLPVKISEEL